MDLAYYEIAQPLPSLVADMKLAAEATGYLFWFIFVIYDELMLLFVIDEYI